MKKTILIKYIFIFICCILISCSTNVEYRVKVYYQDNTYEIIKFVKYDYGDIRVISGCLYQGVNRDTKGAEYPSGSAIRCGVKYIQTIERKEL